MQYTVIPFFNSYLFVLSYKVIFLVREFGIHMKEILVYERVTEAIQVSILKYGAHGIVENSLSM